MSLHEKGRDSTTRPAFSNSHRSSSDKPSYTTNYNQVEALRHRILAEASRYPPGSEIRAWVLNLGGLAQ